MGWPEPGSERAGESKSAAFSVWALFIFAGVHFISALHGSGVGKLFESVREAYDSSTRRVGTSMLMRIMMMAVEHYDSAAVYAVVV